MWRFTIFSDHMGVHSLWSQRSIYLRNTVSHWVVLSGRDWGIYGPKHAIGFLKTLQYQQETLNCPKWSECTIELRNALD